MFWGQPSQRTRSPYGAGGAVFQREGQLCSAAPPSVGLFLGRPLRPKEKGGGVGPTSAQGQEIEAAALPAPLVCRKLEDEAARHRPKSVPQGTRLIDQVLVLDYNRTEDVPGHRPLGDAHRMGLRQSDTVKPLCK